MINITVDGLPEIVKRLQVVEDKLSKTVLKAAVKSGLTVVAQEMRKQIPASMVNARRAINGRVKGSGSRLVAKVGVGVGKKSNRALKERAANRPGVGISGNNLHWWVIGTAGRRTKSGAWRGAMPAMRPGLAKNALATSRGRAIAKMAMTARKRMTKELAKIRKG